MDKEHRAGSRTALIVKSRRDRGDAAEAVKWEQKFAIELAAFHLRKNQIDKAVEDLRAVQLFPNTDRYRLLGKAKACAVDQTPSQLVRWLANEAKRPAERSSAMTGIALAYFVKPRMGK
jgi:hypothetical protein